MLLIGLGLLLLFQALIAPAQLAFTQHAVNDLARALDLPGNAGTGPERPWLWFALLAVSLILGVLIGPVSSLCQALLGDRLTAHLTRAVLVACNSWRGLERFEDPSFADDLEVARTRSSSALEMVLYGARAVLALFTALAIAITLGGLHPLVPVLLVLAQLPSMRLLWEYMNSVGSSLYVLTPKARRLEYLRRISIAPDVAKDVRLAGAHDYLHDRYGREWSESVGELQVTRGRMLRRIVPADLISAVTLALVYAYLVWATVDGRVTIGGLVMFSGAAIMFRAQLVNIGFEIGFLPLPLHFLRPVKRVLEAGPDLESPQDPAPVPEPITQGIAVEDVHFTYPEQEQPVLNGVSFTLGVGESMALVGGNGAGKTTLVKLLLRLYDPTAGRIMMDGIDIRSFDLDELRRRMGVIFQDFGRYELTAAENIGLGDVDHRDDEGRVREAARKGGADELIDALPQGLNTALGRELGDRELSGGQWQRIALSRAFMADNAVLVLDEPTAELDPRGEYEVFERFAELTRDRMTVLVSHRFSTVRMADRIVLLEHGRITEQGDHASLMINGGEYARMYRIQAGQYVDEPGGPRS